jgi:hypothetical protein
MKKTAANERFGASGAVTRLKVCANLQVLRPSERQWKPRLRQALARCLPPLSPTLSPLTNTDAQKYFSLKIDERRRNNFVFLL